MSDICIIKKKIIVQGQRATLIVTILDKNRVAKDMTGVTEIVSMHPATAGGFVKKRLTDSTDPVIIIAGTSKVKITLPKVTTLLMMEDKNVTFFLSIDFPLPLGRVVKKIENAYDLCELETDIDA